MSFEVSHPIGLISIVRFDELEFFFAVEQRDLSRLVDIHVVEHQNRNRDDFTSFNRVRKIRGDEKWLKDSLQCKVKIVPCENYRREMPYSLSVKPSPNLPNDQSINLYASLCFFEGTNVSIGRGTNKQFQIYGSPYLTTNHYSFTPMPNEGAKDPPLNGKVCCGVDLSEITKVNKLELKWLIKAYNETEERSKFFNSYFTKLAGTKKLQLQIEGGMNEEEIRATWKAGLEKFKEMRKKYLIYPDSFLVATSSN